MTDYWPVADPDLQIRGGGHSSRPLDKGGGGGAQKNFFPPLGPQFGSKKREAGRAGPLPWICHCWLLNRWFLKAGSTVFIDRVDKFAKNSIKQSIKRFRENKL